MGEHLDFNQFAARPADVVFDDFAMDGRHLFKGQFARQHHRIGPLREKAHGFGVGDVALGRDVHLLPDAAGIENRRHIGGDDGIDPLAAGAVDDLVDGADFVFVDNRVDRQIGFDACIVGRADDACKVVEVEIGRRGRPHVQLPDAEIDRIGAGLNGRSERLVGAHRGHDFNIGTFHRVLPIKLRAKSLSGAMRDGSTASSSSSANARSNRTEICCSVSRGIS